MVELAATGPGLVDAHAEALAHTRTYVAGTPAAGWAAPTPCEGWDVRTLVGHVVEGNLWVAELTAGRTIDEVGDRLDGDHLGTTPLEGYDLSARAADAAWRRHGALTDPVAVSYGPVPGEVYLGHRFVDVLVHGWDLAAATSQDRTLPADLVEVARQVLEPQAELLAASGIFGEHQDALPGDGHQARLLRSLGRDPDWSAPG